ncbi:MAG TPA: hypothetical protein VHD63_25005 [Ktedonobacteraceae bacterium]|nr:hypothetical protein [Ktedonobacteraceae bacterium]
MSSLVKPLLLFPQIPSTEKEGRFSVPSPAEAGAPAVHASSPQRDNRWRRPWLPRRHGMVALLRPLRRGERPG